MLRTRPVLAVTWFLRLLHRCRDAKDVLTFPRPYSPTSAKDSRPSECQLETRGAERADSSPPPWRPSEGNLVLSVIIITALILP